MAAFEPGQTKEMAGDVTTLNWITPGHEARIEGNLGYHSGRLAEGYWIALLTQEIKPEDFIFAGTTLRSGGREGLPQSDPAADKARRHVTDAMKAELSEADYRAAQERVLSTNRITGSARLTKVLPKIRHDGDMPPSVQYPMGGGGLQWTLTRKCPFLIAAWVAPDGTATTPSFTVNLRGSYEAKAQMRAYLKSA